MKMDVEKKLKWIQNLKMFSLIGFALVGILVYETSKSIYGALGLLPFSLANIVCCVLYASLDKEGKMKMHENAGESITLHFSPYYMGILLISTNVFFWWSAFNH